MATAELLRAVVATDVSLEDEIWELRLTVTVGVCLGFRFEGLPGGVRSCLLSFDSDVAPLVIDFSCSVSIASTEYIVSAIVKKIRCFIDSFVCSDKK